MDAIVYTSNSGFTAEYAELLGRKTGLPVYSLEQAGGQVPKGAEIIYLGWLMASRVKGYSKAKNKYTVRAVCGVGMGETGSQVQELRKANGIDRNLPLFTLQGGFDMDRLHGLYRFMMRTMQRTAGKALANKPDKTPEELSMLDLLQNGGNRVSEDNLSAVLTWLKY